MEIPLVSRPTALVRGSYRASACELPLSLTAFKNNKNRKRKGYYYYNNRVRATVEGGRGERVAVVEERESGYGRGPAAMEVTTFDRSFGETNEFPVWDKIGAVVRLSYGIGKVHYSYGNVDVSVNYPTELAYLSELDMDKRLRFQ